MNAEQVRGLAVVGVADARRLGTVDHLLLDPAARRVVALAVRPPREDAASTPGALDPTGAAFAPPPAGLSYLPTAAVRSVGDDAVMVADGAALLDALPDGLPGDLVSADALAGREVVGADGDSLGQIASVAFDPASFAVSGLEVARGLIRRRSQIPASLVGDLAADPVPVRVAAAARSDRAEERPAENRRPARRPRIAAVAPGDGARAAEPPRRRKSTKGERPPRSQRRRSR